MNKRIFPQTTFAVSEIGLGCWQLGGADWGQLDDKNAYRILGQAVESGINFFDTADVYGNGRSESLVGDFIKGCPETVFVATKLGRTSALFPDNYSEAGVRAATENSLQRLGVEAIDLSQLHCVPTGVMRQGEIFEWMRKLEADGKIKAFGASVESMDEALLCLEQEGLASLQIIFNLFRQKPIEALFEKAQAKNVALIIRLPLASGLLSGRFTKETKFPEQDHRSYNRDGQFFNVGETFAGLPFEKGVELAEALRGFIPEGMTFAEMAQRWILDFDAVTTVITGASKPEQVVANAAVSALPRLPDSLRQRLAEFYRQNVAAFIRGPY